MAGDEWVTAKVKANLTGDETTKARDINVDIFRGTVQLSGFVDTNRRSSGLPNWLRAWKGSKRW